MNIKLKHRESQAPNARYWILQCFDGCIIMRKFNCGVKMTIKAASARRVMKIVIEKPRDTGYIEIPVFEGESPYGSMESFDSVYLSSFSEDNKRRRILTITTFKGDEAVEKYVIQMDENRLERFCVWMEGPRLVDAHPFHGVGITKVLDLFVEREKRGQVDWSAGVNPNKATIHDAREYLDIRDLTGHGLGSGPYRPSLYRG